MLQKEKVLSGPLASLSFTTHPNLVFPVLNFLYTWGSPAPSMGSVMGFGKKPQQNQQPQREGEQGPARVTVGAVPAHCLPR